MCFEESAYLVHAEDCFPSIEDEVCILCEVVSGGAHVAGIQCSQQRVNKVLYLSGSDRHSHSSYLKSVYGLTRSQWSQSVDE